MTERNRKDAPPDWVVTRVFASKDDRAGPFERLVEFEPAYHEVHEDPKKNYGVGGVRIRFVLRGPMGATQFLMGTDWHLPETWAWWAKTGRLSTAKSIKNPNGWDLGYHAKKPQYDGHTLMDKNCPHTGGKCYYDGSALRAEPVLEALLKEGHEAVWKALEAEYRRLK